MNQPENTEQTKMDREERIQRQMDFIIEQQAQFSIDIETYIIVIDVINVATLNII